MEKLKREPSNCAPTIYNTNVGVQMVHMDVLLPPDGNNEKAASTSEVLRKTRKAKCHMDLPA